MVGLFKVSGSSKQKFSNFVRTRYAMDYPVKPGNDGRGVRFICVNIKCHLARSG